MVGAYGRTTTKTMEKINFIKEIVLTKKTDGHNHQQFIRYSKGTFENRAYYHLKISGQKLTVFCGFELVNDLIYMIIKNNEEIEVKGKVYAKEKLHALYLANEEKKKGFFIYTINDHLTKEQAEEFYETCKETYILVQIKAKDAELKANPKPHNPRGKYIEKFCKVITEGKIKAAILDALAWDCPQAKDIEARHTLAITTLNIPPGIENDTVQARLDAKRVGIMYRHLVVDGQETTKEFPFEG